MKDYLTVTAGQSGRSDLEDTTAFISGTLFNLPAGGLKAVVGFEHRSFAGFLDYDDQINRATVTGNQIGDVSRVKTKTSEYFTELEIPVLKDLPGAQSLDLNASYRTSSPNQGDDYDTWGYGLNWQPIHDLRIRASKARAVRTPVPDDLSGVSQTFGTIDDPCTVGGIATADPAVAATRIANCAADGVPIGYAPQPSVTQSVSGFVGGNPDLGPEVGDTLTYGFVWQPSFVAGFSLSVDRFDIKVEDVINTVGRQIKADLCYDTAERLFCDDVVRGTHPLVDGPYALVAVNDQLVNVAEVKIKGIDVEAAYRFKLGDDAQFGNLGVRVVGTFYDQADQTPLPGEETLDFLGYAGGSTSDQGWLKRQIVSTVNYKFRGFTADWSARMIGSAYMAPSFESFGKIGTHIYHDLRFSYSWAEGSNVYFGIDNVADKDPPFFVNSTSGTQALDTIPAYYDVFGRTFFGGLTLKF